MLPPSTVLYPVPVCRDELARIEGVKRERKEEKRKKEEESSSNSGDKYKNTKKRNPAFI